MRCHRRCDSLPHCHTCKIAFQHQCPNSLCHEYAACLLLIATGFHLAPNMTWPITHTDWLAVNLIILGCIAKLLGHALLLFNQRV